MNDNYTVLHLHSMFGNGGFIDSTVRYNEYIDKAKECGMNAIAFTEHGSIFSWYKKKKYCEENGLKYIHASEMYVTETLEDKVRDNYHCCLYSANFDGFKELNKLSSLSWKRNEQNRYYYNPRITLDELINTSDNIIITSACVGGILGKGNDDVKEKFIDFMSRNKHRCFLEIQPFFVDKQIEYNKYLYDLHLKTGIRLTVGTDTHCLSETESRDMLQKSKNISFENEAEWDLTFKDYETLVKSFEKQNAIPIDVVLNAIENTNIIANMVDPFELDYSNKYPHIYDNPEEIILKRIEEGIEERGVDRSKYQDRINYELETYKKNDALQFLLLEDKVKNYCRNNNIRYGYSRGSISGSYIAYLLRITDIDSEKWDMSFERFMSPERISLADIDTDYPPSKRDMVKDYLYNESGLNCCDIITHNTIALKGAIRDVARAMGIDLSIVNEICENIENSEDKYRKKYPKLFEFVDKLNGTIVSVGSHPCGLVVSDYDIEGLIGTFTTSTSEYPITQIDMKEIDAQNYVKLDLLGLDNIELIQNTCELAGIDWIETDKIDFDDENVWDSIIESSCMVFQWESSFAHTVYKKLFSKETLRKIKEINPNITYIDLFSMGNGAIRPAGSSYRDKLCNGEFNDNGHEALNNLLSDTLGFLIYQEQILKFLNEFCGYTKGEADIVRRGFAKKTGTEQYLPKIKSGFIETMNEKYGEDTKKYEELIVSFLEVIDSASLYAFSKNHSHPYSMIGYVCSYLRYYYPTEFICSALNIYKDKEEKTSEIMEYSKIAKVKINPIKFRKSKSEYFIDKENNTIYKGIGSIKFLNDKVAEELYGLGKNEYLNFVDLLYDIDKTSTNSKQLNILTGLDFFSEFGNSRELIRIIDTFTFFKNGAAKSIKKEKIIDETMLNIISKYATDKNKKGDELKSFSIFDCKSILLEYEEYIKSLNIEDFDYKYKIYQQKEYLGYISPTGKEEDRAILLVKKIYPLNRKKDNKQFGYSIITQSIGSGVESRFTIFNKNYEEYGEILNDELIKCISWKRDKEYFIMEKYETMI